MKKLAAKLALFLSISLLLMNLGMGQVFANQTSKNYYDIDNDPYYEENSPEQGHEGHFIGEDETSYGPDDDYDKDSGGFGFNDETTDQSVYFGNPDGSSSSSSSSSTPSTNSNSKKTTENETSEGKTKDTAEELRKEETSETKNDPPTPNNEALKEYTFDVGNVFDLDPDSSEKQELKYFKDPEHSPIVSFILMIINFATRIIGSIAVILFIIAGFMMMFAQGNQQTLDNAKDVVKYAAIGLIVTFFSYVIATFIQSIFVAGT